MKSPHEVIKILNAHTFHDMPVTSIEFNTDIESNTKFILKILEYNEDKQGYRKLQISFNDLQKLESTNIYLKPESDMEIYMFEYDFNETFECKLLLLLGHGEPSLAINLSCLSIEIISE